MTHSARSRVALALVLMAALAAPALLAQRTGYTPEEFVRRRAALMAQVKDGPVILFGDAAVPAGTHFRQDNDFYYFTGNEDLNAALVLDAKSGAATRSGWPAPASGCRRRGAGAPSRARRARPGRPHRRGR